LITKLGDKTWKNTSNISFRLPFDCPEMLNKVISQLLMGSLVTEALVVIHKLGELDRVGLGRLNNC
jgi:hypothetical protein